MVKLDPVLFSNGMNYFSDPARLLPKSRSECLEKADSCKTLVVHNNFVTNYSAKVYRFKEALLWTYDNGT
jgi:hypothetical protein